MFIFKSFLIFSVITFIFSLDDYYKILGVSRNADKKTIKKAFVELSKKHHPDKKQSDIDESLYTQIINAYETLKDQEKKSDYDQKLLYGENDYSDEFFGQRARKPNFYQNQYRFYDNDGNFYTFHDRNKNFKPYMRNDQTFDFMAYIYSFIPSPSEIILGIIYELPNVLENFMRMISVIMLIILFLINIFLDDFCYVFKKK